MVRPKGRLDDMITQGSTATDTERSYALPALLATVRDELRNQRARRAARRRLEADLATYTSPADLDELDAVLDRYDETQVADIRTIVHRQRAVA
jgi:hypothetical protein